MQEKDKKIKIKYITNARMPTEKAHGYQICKICESFSYLGNRVKLIIQIRDSIIYKDLFGQWWTM